MLKCLNSKALVVSEPGNDEFLVKKWEDVIFFAEYGQKFIEKVQYVLSLPEGEKQKMREKNFLWLKNKNENIDPLCDVAKKLPCEKN